MKRISRQDIEYFFLNIFWKKIFERKFPFSKIKVP